MSSTIENPDIKKVNADHAVVIAVSHRAVFGPDDGEVYGAGVAFPFLQAVQKVNERLLEGNPSELLLFDVVLITTDGRQQQQSECVCSSTRHHGLQINRFCFSSEDNFADSLLQKKVHLFLTTDRNEATQAANKGVFSAFLDQQTASCPSEQLRVMFCGDAIFDPNSGSQQAAQVFWAKLGQMRQKFSLLDSPLNIVLLTSHGGRDSCGRALRSLRTKGVSVDEAHCLAGAPRSLMLSVLRPHFQLSAPEE